MRLLRSHAVDAGPPVPDREVRAMLGGAPQPAVPPGFWHRPGVLPALVTMLNDNALPLFAASGPSGRETWPPWPGTALTLMGERAATRPLRPMPAWGPGSALPFISSSALTLGRRVWSSTSCGAWRTQLRSSTPSVSPGGRQPIAVVGRSGRVRLVDGRRGRCPTPGRPAAAVDPASADPGPVRTPGLRGHPRRGRRRVGPARAIWSRTSSNGPRRIRCSSGWRSINHGAFYQAGLGLSLDAVNAPWPRPRQSRSPGSGWLMSRIRAGSRPFWPGRRRDRRGR